MKEKEFENVRKELLIKMKFMDTTIKGISESDEYKANCAYNAGIRDAVDVLQKHVLNTADEGWILCKDQMPPMPKVHEIFKTPLEVYFAYIKNSQYPTTLIWNGNCFMEIGVINTRAVEDVVAWMPCSIPAPYAKKYDDFDDASEATRKMCEDAEKKFRESCYDMIEAISSPEEMVKIMLEEYEKFTDVKADTFLNMNIIETAKTLSSGEKALLTVNTPAKCADCDIHICYKQYAYDPGDHFCGKTRESVNPEKKPTWCPLVSVGKEK